MRNDPRADWERFGRDDPYYGVYADARFRRRNLTPEALAEFFASGSAHVDAVLDVIRRTLDPAFAPKRALELGCGVGRLLIPLAACCGEVVGVDVSGAMVEEARKNLAERGIANVTVRETDGALSGVEGPFDWVHSFIVLQHVPVAAGEQLLSRLVALLRDGGIGVVQITFANDLPWHSRVVRWARQNVPFFHPLWNLRHGKPVDAPHMQMNAYPLERIFRLLQDGGCHECSVRFTKHFGDRGLVLFFRKASAPSFP